MQMLNGEGFSFLPSCKPHAEKNSSSIYFQELQYPFFSLFFFFFTLWLGKFLIYFHYMFALRSSPCRSTHAKDLLPGNAIRATLIISVCFTQLFFFCY